MRFAHFGLLVALISATAIRSEATHLEAGNDAYRVSITSSGRPQTGFYTAWTGPAHPVSAWIGNPAEVLPFTPECPSCGGEAAASAFVIRSRTSGWDYTLGGDRPRGMFVIAEPGHTCICANDLTTPAFDEIVEGGRTVGLRGTWDIRNGGDDLHVEESVRVHGEDWIGSAVEVTLRVTNTGTTEARLGVRAITLLFIDLPTFGSAGALHLALRPPDPPLEPSLGTETEWSSPTFRMWQAHAGATPSRYPDLYSIAGTVTGPAATLDPAPTPPDMIQYAEGDALSRLHSGGGSFAGCFEWHIPEPPRDITRRNRTSMASYWGLDDAGSLIVPPGGDISVTQYFVAFTEYPLSVETSGSFEADCDGPVAVVPIDGRAVLTDTTSAPIVYHWSSTSPEVTFDDPASPTTNTHVVGAGAFPVTLTVAVGAYEASAETTVIVLDESPPELRLIVTPDSLWPPNHRLRDVTVRAEATDNCGDATITLVDVTSSEPSDDRGDGHTASDIQGVEPGTADFHVLLRAERDGRRCGRTYWLRYRATDAAGNTSEAVATVVVPHDQRTRRR